LGELAAQEAEIRALEGRRNEAIAQLSAELSKVGCVEIGSSSSLGIALRMAIQVSEEVVETRRSQRELRRQVDALPLQRYQTRCDELVKALSLWQERWLKATTSLLLPEKSTPALVQKALVVLETTFENLKDAQRLIHRVDRITENIAAFEQRVSEIVAATDFSLTPLPAEAAITQLGSRLSETGNADVEKRALEAQNQRDAERITSLSSRAEAAAKILNELKQVAGCTTDHELEQAINSWELRKDKEEEYASIATGIIQRNANSDLEMIEAEAKAYQLDSLQSEIATAEARLKELDDEMLGAGSEHGRLQSEFEQMQNADRASLQSQVAEDALASARPAISQYVRLKIASGALRLAIESYREKHQGPVLTRASQLFSALTLHRFAGLTTGFNSADKPVIMAVRQNGQQVEVEGLSDGSVDQLFLALRLAAIEHHVDRVAGCPVILDDVLINSDDTRSKAALDVFAELGRKTQVLLFTHHNKVAELAGLSGAQILELGGQAMIAGA